MNYTFKHEVKLNTHLMHTETWARIEQDGRLVIEFYDYSDQAEAAFGNDVAYLLVVALEDKLLILSTLESDNSLSCAEADPDVRLLSLLQQRFDSYFLIQEWFQANAIPFKKIFDGWA